VGADDLTFFPKPKDFAALRGVGGVGLVGGNKKK